MTPWNIVAGNDDRGSWVRIRVGGVNGSDLDMFLGVHGYDG